MMEKIPVWEKYALTIKEAADYSGIGEKKLRRIAEEHDELVIRIGVKVLFKRAKLEKFLDQAFSI